MSPESADLALMPATAPAQWPAGSPAVAVGMAAGYAVRASGTPDELRRLRLALGLPHPVAPTSPGDTQHALRRTRHRLRILARRLGPPPGLADLVAAIGAAEILDVPAATRRLQAAGAGELADPAVLRSIALVCQVPVPWTFIDLHGPTVGDQAPDPVPVPAVVAARPALVRARRVVEQVLWRLRVRPWADLEQAWQDQGIHFDVADPEPVWRHLDVIPVGGASAGEPAWAVHAGSHPRGLLERTLARIALNLGPVPLPRLVEGLDRCIATSKTRSRPTKWPPTSDALRAWLDHHPAWQVHSPTTVDAPVTVTATLDAAAVQLARASTAGVLDRTFTRAIRNHGGQATYSQLIESGRAAGLPRSTVSLGTVFSPLVYKPTGRRWFRLLDD